MFLAQTISTNESGTFRITAHAAALDEQTQDGAQGLWARGFLGLTFVQQRTGLVFAFCAALHVLMALFGSLKIF